MPAEPVNIWGSVDGPREGGEAGMKVWIRSGRKLFCCVKLPSSPRAWDERGGSPAHPGAPTAEMEANWATQSIEPKSLFSPEKNARAPVIGSGRIDYSANGNGTEAQPNGTRAQPNGTRAHTNGELRTASHASQHTNGGVEAPRSNGSETSQRVNGGAHDAKWKSGAVKISREAAMYAPAPTQYEMPTPYEIGKFKKKKLPVFAESNIEVHERKESKYIRLETATPSPQVSFSISKGNCSRRHSETESMMSEAPSEGSSIFETPGTSRSINKPREGTISRQPSVPHTPINNRSAAPPSVSSAGPQSISSSKSSAGPWVAHVPAPPRTVSNVNPAARSNNPSPEPSISVGGFSRTNSQGISQEPMSPGPSISRAGSRGASPRGFSDPQEAPMPPERAAWRRQWGNVMLDMNLASTFQHQLRRLRPGRTAEAPPRGISPSEGPRPPQRLFNRTSSAASSRGGSSEPHPPPARRPIGWGNPRGAPSRPLSPWSTPEDPNADLPPPPRRGRSTKNGNPSLASVSPAVTPRGTGTKIELFVKRFDHR